MNLSLSYALFLQGLSFWNYVFIIIVILLGMGVISAAVEEKREARIDEERKNAEQKNNNLIEEIRKRYKVLIPLIVNLYEVKACPKCGENKMQLNNISPTGQSIEYQCIYCHKTIVGKLLAGKDGSEAISQLNEIKQLFKSFVAPIDPDFLKTEIDTSFIVSPPDSLIYRKQRSYIPDSVRHEVWRRDGGRCVECGSQENLEFDHIIPVSKGGANTARNLQLLCESCNRKKSDKI